MINNQKLGLLAIKVLVIWLALSISGFFGGERLINALIPFYEFTVESASDDYSARIFIEQQKVENKIVLAATPLKPKPITPEKSWPAGRTIESKITVLHALVPIVILFTIVLAWPTHSIRQRVYLLLMAIPALFLVSALTAPLQLLGTMEIGFQNAAMKNGFSKEEPLVLSWMLLTEGGGRWLIPVLAGVACGGIVSTFSGKD